MTEWTVNNKLNDWYQKQYHIKLPKEFETKSEIYFGGSSFSPSALFALAEPGVWYDPSDVATLYQDPAGTTPVTTPGQTVGLMLDKSKGLALGAELVTNGDFASNIDGWLAQSNVTMAWDSSGRLAVTPIAEAFSSSNAVGFEIATVSGKLYKFSAQFSVANVQLRQMTSGGFSGVTTATLSGTSGDFCFVANSSTTRIGFRDTLNVNRTIFADNISVRELPGNHATQATLASRPIYGIEPVGGRRNLLLATDTLATQSLTVTAVAHTLAFTGTGTVTLTGASIAGPLIGTGASNRVSLTFTPTAASLTLTVVGSVTLAQLELGSTATAYQRVTTQYDVTEAGVASTSYLAFDGVDDGMVTGTITPGVDKAQVFAGVRKISDAAVGLILEGAFTGDGVFYLLGSGNSGIYQFFSRGSVSVFADGLTAFPAPSTNVLTGLGDIGGDVATIRVDGALRETVTADQGTGNYTAQPLYIGRRGNSSLPFSGRIYSLITRFGANLDAGVITNTETWVAGKTGIVI